MPSRLRTRVDSHPTAKLDSGSKGRYLGLLLGFLLIWGFLIFAAPARLFAGIQPPADTDGDGMPDAWETLYFLNPQSPEDAKGDADGDGLSNLDEFLHNTVPIQADSDYDGLTDGQEVNDYSTDPLRLDSDWDWLSDWTEVNTYLSDPLTPDTDTDGYLDGTEVVLGSDPKDAASTPGSGSQALTAMDSGNEDPQISAAVDENNNLHVIYTLGSSADTYDVNYLMIGAAGDILIDRTRFATPGGWPRMPDLAVDSENIVHVVFQDGGGGGDAESYYLQINPYLDDRSGDAADPAVIGTVDPLLLTPDSTDDLANNHPHLAVGPDGSIYITGKVMSYGQNSGAGDIWFVRIDREGNFIAPYTQLLGGTVHHKADPRLVVQSDGSVLVFYRDTAYNESWAANYGSRLMFVYRLNEFGLPLEAPVYVAGGGYYGGPAAAVRPDGNDGAVLVYSSTKLTEDGDSEDKEIFTARVNSDGLWRVPPTRLTVYDDDAGDTHPRFGMDADGNLNILSARQGDTDSLRYTFVGLDGQVIIDRLPIPDSATSCGQYYSRNFDVVVDREGAGHLFFTDYYSDPEDIMHLRIPPLMAPIPDPVVTFVYPQEINSTYPNEIFIFGRNFLSGAAVHLGENSIDLPDVEVLNPVIIRASVPCGTPLGVYDVTVLNDPYSRKGTLEDALTLTLEPGASMLPSSSVIGSFEGLPGPEGKEGESGGGGCATVPVTGGKMDGANTAANALLLILPLLFVIGLRKREILRQVPQNDTKEKVKNDVISVLLNAVKNLKLLAIGALFLAIFAVSASAAPIRITNDGNFSQWSKLAVDSLGNVHIVWTDTRVGGREIWYTMLDASGTTLIDDTRLTNNGNNSNHPDVVVDSTDKVHVIWSDRRLGRDEIFYKKIDPYLDDRSGDAAVLGTIQLIGDTALTADDDMTSSRPKAVIDGSDNIHIAWVDRRNGWARYVYYMKINSSGVKLVNDTQVSSSGEAVRRHRNIMMAVDSLGNAHLVWGDTMFGNDNTAYTMLDGSNGNTLINETRISTTSEGRTPWIALDSNDNAYVAWISQRFWNGGNVYFRSFNPYLDDRDGSAADINAITITSPKRLTTPNSRRPMLAFDSQDHLFMAWQDYRTGRLQVYSGMLSLSGDISEETELTTGNSYLNQFNWPRNVDPDLEVVSGFAHITYVDQREGNPEIYYIRQTAWLDVDADGLLDPWEIQYFGNLSQGPGGDFDSDGLSNLQEYALSINPANPDSDGDGLTDGQEVNTYGTSPSRADTDGDGFPDGTELDTGTDPLDDLSTPIGAVQTLTAFSGGDRYPQMRAAVDGNNNVHLVFTLYDASDSYDLNYMMLGPDSNILIDRTRFSTGYGWPRKPDLAVDDQNRVHIVYQDAPSNIESFYLQIDPYLDDRSGDAADPLSITLAGPTQLTPNNDYLAQNHPRVRVGPDGSVYIIGKTMSYGENSSCGDIWLVVLDSAGEVLYPFSSLAGGNVHHKADPQLVVQEDGKMLAFYRDNRSYYYSRMTWVYPLNEFGYPAEAPFYAGGGGYYGGPAASVVPDGNDGAVLVYAATNLTGEYDQKEIFTARLNRDGVWRLPPTRLLEYNGGDADTHPRFAMDPDGNLNILTNRQGWANEPVRYTLVDYNGNLIIDRAILPGSRSYGGEYFADNYCVVVDSQQIAHFFYSNYGDNPEDIRYLRFSGWAPTLPAPVVESVTPGSIPENTEPTEITIAGQNFRPGAAVHLEGIVNVDLPGVEVSDAETIKATVPCCLMPGTYNVKVMNDPYLKGGTLADALVISDPDGADHLLPPGATIDVLYLPGPAGKDGKSGGGGCATVPGGKASPANGLMLILPLLFIWMARKAEKVEPAIKAEKKHSKLISACFLFVALSFFFTASALAANIRLTSDGSMSEWPNVARDGNGNLHIVWTDTRSGNWDIWYTMLDANGSTLIDDSRVTTTGGVSRWPDVVVDSSNMVHIFWQNRGAPSAKAELQYKKIDPYSDDRDGSNVNVQIITLADRILTPNDGFCSERPAAVLDNAGNIQVAWRDYRRPGYLHYMKLDTNGNNLINDTQLTSSGGFHWGHDRPKIAVDANNNAHIVWSDNMWGGEHVAYMMVNGATGATLIAPTRISIAVSRGNKPAIALNSTNKVYVHWTDRDNTGSLMLNAFDPYLDDRDGSPANLNAISIFGPVRTTPTTWSRQPAIAFDSGNHLSLAWMYNNQLYYSLVNQNTGEPYSISQLTTAADLRYGSGPRRNWIDMVMGGSQANIIYRDNQWGNPEIAYSSANGFVDVDGDGLLDSWEIQSFGNLSQGAAGDPDSDGLTNQEEFDYGTNPTNPDTDGDGLTDGAEVNTYGTSPTKWDTDGDGFSDYGEIMIYGTDPLNPLDSPLGTSRLVTSLNSGDEYPQIWAQADSNLNIHLIFTLGSTSDTYDLNYMMLDPTGGILIDRTRFATDSDWPRMPRLAVDAFDRVHIVYQDQPSNTESYYLQIDPYLDDRSGDAADPGSIIRFGPLQLTPEDDNLSGNHPHPTIGTDGSVYIVGKTMSYGEQDGAGDVWLTRLDPDGNVLIPYTLLLGGQVHHKAEPHLVVKSDGSLLLFFRDNREYYWGSKQEYVYPLSEIGAPLEAPLYIGGGGEGGSPAAEVLPDGNDGAVLVYADSTRTGDYESKEVFTARVNRDGEWRTNPLRVLDWAGKSDSHPRFGMDTEGNLHILSKINRTEDMVRYSLVDSEGNLVIDRARLIGSNVYSSGQYYTRNYCVAVDSARNAHLFFTSYGNDPEDIYLFNVKPTLIPPAQPAPVVSSVTPGELNNALPAEIIITGQNFRPGAAVHLGAASIDLAEVEVVSSTEIVAQVPCCVPSGTYDVSVLNWPYFERETKKDALRVTADGGRVPGGTPGTQIGIRGNPGAPGKDGASGGCSSVPGTGSGPAGMLALIFPLAFIYGWKKREILMKKRFLILGLILAAGLLAAPLPAGAGISSRPDAFGYLLNDSTAVGAGSGPVLPLISAGLFTDVAGAAVKTGVVELNQSHAQIELPEPFVFYGVSCRYLTISANGFMVLSASALADNPVSDLSDLSEVFRDRINVLSQGGKEEKTPGSLLEELSVSVIAPLGMELDLTQGGIYFEESGTAGARMWTIEWKNASLSRQSDAALNFKVVLDQATGEVKIAYWGISAGVLDLSQREAPVIGIKGPALLDRVAYSLPESSLREQTVLSFAVDQDRDGLSSVVENFLGTSDLLIDSDGDGVSDLAEVLTGTDPTLAGDAVPLLDTDSDGLPDVVEDAWGTKWNREDTDRDGLSDYDEIFTYGTDPLHHDTDRDGLSDYAEVKEYLSDPLNPDTNHNGISDLMELASYGSPLSGPPALDADPAADVTSAAGGCSTVGTSGSGSPLGAVIFLLVPVLFIGIMRRRR